MTTEEINKLTWFDLINKLKKFFKSIKDSIASLTNRIVDLENAPPPSQDFIPLTGTTEGNPVTGDVEFQAGKGLKCANANENGYNKVSIGDSSLDINLDGNELVGYTLSETGFSCDKEFIPLTPKDFIQKSYVDAQRPYKVYTALLTQSGTDAPVATVLENTLGEEIVWSYSAVGYYFGSISHEGFVKDKTIGFVSNNASGGRYVLIDVYGLTPDQIGLQIKDSDTNLSIDGLSGQPIEIRVYN